MDEILEYLKLLNELSGILEKRMTSPENDIVKLAGENLREDLNALKIVAQSNFVTEVFAEDESKFDTFLEALKLTNGR